MAKKHQPGCPCCSSIIPPSPSPLCVSGCNGARVPGAHVVVTNGDGDVVLDGDTGSNGCTESILWDSGGYSATITPPVGIDGWDVTTRDFTMPGGLILPIPLKLSDGYTCGCNTPDRHDYFGVGDPKPVLPETLFFSCAVGSCALQWFPWQAGSPFNAGVYYGSFPVYDLLSSTAGSVPFCTQLTPKNAVADVFFNPCGLFQYEITNACFQASSGGPFNYGGLLFGVRYKCGCVACNAFEGGLLQFNLVPDPATAPLANPHVPSADIPNGMIGPVFAGNFSLQDDPFLWAADHADAWYGRGIGDCLRVDWCPAGTAIVSA